MNLKEEIIKEFNEYYFIKNAELSVEKVVEIQAFISKFIDKVIEECEKCQPKPKDEWTDGQHAQYYNEGINKFLQNINKLKQ